ncbi:hypothetical protein [Streptomyces sp. NPDC057284]|uniref:hypothetical protein n=1 Tax=Streptomyces sp. NPDC057284 TaxID=3346083 RepID=UPI00362CAF87
MRGTGALDHRGAVIGTLLSGSIGGMLLAPTFSGALGEWLGWRHPYLAAAALVLLPAGLWACSRPANPACIPADDQGLQLGCATQGWRTLLGRSWACG